jgi:predicted DNA-binding protein YlxM (UPF0122 family)
MRYREKKWLKQQYKDKTASEIAELEGVTTSTITRWLRKHDIETSRGTSQAEGEYKDKEWLREKYIDEDRSMADIGDEFGVSKETIKYWLKKHDIPIRNFSEAAKRRVDEHPHTIPDNTQLNPTFYQRRGYNIVKGGEADTHVEMHRLLATLLVDEIDELEGKHVHHKNGIRWDNRLDNLEVMTISEHTKHHHSNGDYPQSS